MNRNAFRLFENMLRNIAKRINYTICGVLPYRPLHPFAFHCYYSVIVASFPFNVAKLLYYLCEKTLKVRQFSYMGKHI